MGSEFTVNLPLARDGGAGESAQRERRGATVARRRVLVADDNADAASTLGTMLELLGHEILTANDGADAVDKARTFAPDIVFLDVGMPRMNGYDACEAIRKLPGGNRMTIIALTGWGQESHKQRSREAGFDRHFVKPVALEELQAIFDNPPQRE